MPEFAVRWRWSTERPYTRDPVEASFAKFSIVLNDLPVTAFHSDKGENGDELDIPLYHLAEWMAENWWALLYEPRKTEESGEDSRFRHAFRSAGRGFVLPDIDIYTVDSRLVQVKAAASRFDFARITLVNAEDATLDRKAVATELENFVDSVAERMSQMNFRTNMQEVWQAFKSLDEEERYFCQLLGMTGLSPYEDNGSLEDVIERLASNFDKQIATDFCEAASADVFEAAASLLDRSFEDLDKATPLDISPLFAIDFLKDYDRGPPYQLGYEAAETVRRAFDIDPAEPQGSRRIFSRLGLDEVVQAEGRDDFGGAVFQGAVCRDDAKTRMTLLRRGFQSRRFDAARGCFLACCAKREGPRLVTRARVRDQQASRAFAAELLAPAAFLRDRAGQGSLSTDRIAEELDVSPLVIERQARNNGLSLSG